MFWFIRNINWENKLISFVSFADEWGLYSLDRDQGIMHVLDSGIRATLKKYWGNKLELPRHC